LENYLIWFKSPNQFDWKALRMRRGRRNLREESWRAKRGMKEFFVEYNRLLVLAALLTILLMATLLGAPVLATPDGGIVPY
jgi:hypothetical protein